MNKAQIKEAIETEARRLARRLIKDDLKAHGVRVSYVKANEITEAVKELLIAEPSIYRQAEGNVK
jgi:hypothetical protein